MFNIFAGGWLDGRGAIGWWELCGKVSCTLRKREAFLLLTGCFFFFFFLDLGTKVMDLQNEGNNKQAGVSMCCTMEVGYQVRCQATCIVKYSPLFFVYRAFSPPSHTPSPSHRMSPMTA